MGEWGGPSNFNIPDTESSLALETRRPRQPSSQDNVGSVTDHEKFILAINNIVEVPEGWQCHVCGTLIPSSAYEAWVHTHESDHRRRRPPKPKRPADIPECFDVRDYSGGTHCEVCRVRLTSYASHESHLRGRQHLYRLSERRNRALHQKYS